MRQARVACPVPRDQQVGRAYLHAELGMGISHAESAEKRDSTADYADGRGWEWAIVGGASLPRVMQSPRVGRLATDGCLAVPPCGLSCPDSPVLDSPVAPLVRGAAGERGMRNGHDGHDGLDGQASAEIGSATSIASTVSIVSIVSIVSTAVQLSSGDALLDCRDEEKK